MDHAFSTLMFLFACALLFYAALMAITKDYNLIPLQARVSVKPKNPEAYTQELSKGVALAAAAPALSGLVGLWNASLAIIALVPSMAICLWLATKVVKKAK